MSGFPDPLQDQKSAQTVRPEGGTRRGSLTQERVRELLDYDPETGILTWRVSRSSRQVKGRAAGHIGKGHGYGVLGIDGSGYLQHRVIWLWVHGYLPENQIDHVNRCKTDNRLNNLREISRACNSANSGVPADNTSGVRGISFERRRMAWVAYISVSRGGKRLGQTKDFVEAVALRLAGEQCLGWGDCDGSSSAAQFMKKYLQEIQCQPQD